MKLSSAVVLGIVLLFGTVTLAQDYPRIEIPVGYSFMRFNPENSNIVSGFSLNGGGGGVIFNITHVIGIEAEFDGYSSLSKTFTFPATSGSPCPAGCTVKADGNLFTYNVGPVVKLRREHFEPFVETLFGGAHSNTYQNLFKACQGACTTTSNPSNNAFDFIIGGGIDIPVNKYISIRPAQFDYVLTRFGNGFTRGNQNQSNFRYQAGVVFRFLYPPPPPKLNHSPVASCSADPASVYQGSTDAVAVHVNASDPDNDPLSYTYTATGGAVDGTGPNARWNPSGVALGTYTVNAKVDDGRGGTATCDASITVNKRPNRPPLISCAPERSSIIAGERVNVISTASDPDGDPLTYSYQTSGGQISGTGATAQFDSTGVKPGGYSITCNADDGQGGRTSAATMVDVKEHPEVKELETRLSLHDVFFPTAQPTAAMPTGGLLTSQEKTLDTLVSDFTRYLSHRPKARLLLEGHADSRGPKEYNQKLSERRAERAKTYLVEHGIPADQIDTRAHGFEQNRTNEEVKILIEESPDLSSEDKQKLIKEIVTVRLANNRRVDVTLIREDGQPMPAASAYPFNAADALTLLSRGAGTKKGEKPAPKP
jgi:outer membrane protein OmpA-like peptidoglycan-associated protein